MDREFDNRSRREEGPRNNERTPRHFRDGVRPIHPKFEDKPVRPERSFRPIRPRQKQKTKMFTSKDELVTFVNEKGEEGHRIDVYKIEENLYKVVIIERLID